MLSNNNPHEDVEVGNFAFCLLTFIGKFIYSAAMTSIDTSLRVLITLKTISFPGMLEDSNIRMGLLRQTALETEQLLDSLSFCHETTTIVYLGPHPVNQFNKCPFSICIHSISSGLLENPV